MYEIVFVCILLGAHMLMKKYRQTLINAIKCRMFKSRKHQTPPGPSALFIFGNMFELSTERMAHQLNEWCKKFGKLYKFKIFRKNVVVLSDVELLRKAFRDAPYSNSLNDRSVNAARDVFYGGKHVGCADLGPETLRLRNILQRDWMHYCVQQDIFENCHKHLINSLLKDMLSDISGRNINIDQCVNGYLTRLHHFMLIGEFISDDDPDRDALWDFTDHLYALLDPSIDMPLRILPLLRFLPGKYGRLYRETIKARDRVARRYFDSQKVTYQDGQVRGLVDVCVKIQHDEMTSKGSTWLTDDYIKGLMYDTVAAGMSEIKKSIRILILLLCHYQEVQARVYEEISSVTRHGKELSLSHRTQMPYTQAVILEMLRYVSQTPMAIPHKCNKDLVFDGVFIEKNSGIIPNIWGIHHDEKIWGDPWVFRPDRFLDENGQTVHSEHTFMRSLVPFSVGKRRCPGEEFAMSRIFLILVSVLQKLQFAPPESEELPPADPRLYSNKYPQTLPIFTCRVLKRKENGM